VGLGAIVGAFALLRDRQRGGRRIGGIALGALGAGCLLVATFLPFLLGARPSLGRPSTTARLEIVSPSPGQTFRGDPARIPVTLRLEGGEVVPFTSFRLVPNTGHIHLFVDGAVVSMTTALSSTVTAPPGSHELVAEFVAVDHGPFDPPVRVTTPFSVTG